MKMKFIVCQENANVACNITFHINYVPGQSSVTNIDFERYDAVSFSIFEAKDCNMKHNIDLLKGGLHIHKTTISGR